MDTGTDTATNSDVAVAATTASASAEQVAEDLRLMDDDGRLIGVVTWRDLLVSGPGERIGDVMLKNPFFLRVDADLVDAMKVVVRMHFS